MLSAFQNFHAISAIISFKLKISSWKLNQNGDTPNGNQKLISKSEPPMQSFQFRD